jgi:hypothetical protein
MLMSTVSLRWPFVHLCMFHLFYLFTYYVSLGLVILGQSISYLGCGVNKYLFIRPLDA